MRMSIILLSASLSVILNVVEGGSLAPMTDALRQRIVDRHNEIRKQVSPQAANMKKLKYNHDLEEMAKLWAKGCVFEHGEAKYPNKPYPQSGQSLYKGGNSDLIVQVNAWEGEKPYYSYSGNKCNAPPNKMCGHYLQEIWATTLEVGCAVGNCGNWFLGVCQYGPQGNLPGVHPYRSGPACSKCPPSAPMCDNGLCVAPDPSRNSVSCQVQCENNGVLDGSTCTCKCPEGYTGDVCSRECKNLLPMCGNGWYPNMCGTPSIAAYCPKMCNKC